ncbi:MAG: murein biosynthesis integral membrane protein MurJ [Puniceicoccales bacterium]|jgi:putative peptidoglycan lipid II flippase|nr:murein biosynthesis integral membrane protein MurJ [Puniceicoccales bacterium]
MSYTQKKHQIDFESQSAHPLQRMSGEHSVVSVAWATAASRVGGLFRDVVIFALLGLSPWNGAFLFAFTVPNLFRRLFGEGALTSALIPVYADVFQKDPPEAHRLLNAVLTRLTLALLIAIGVFALCVAGLWPFLSASGTRALGLTVLLSPYLICACIAAMICGALNVENTFGWPALTAVFLNVAILAFGLLGFFLGKERPLQCTLLLCAGVLAGGGLQILIPWCMLQRKGWQWRMEQLPSESMGRLWKLFLPAILGAAVTQINTTLSRILAYCFTPDGISTLYLSSRLTELPLGIFVFAIASVAFPGLSKAAAGGDFATFSENYRRAQRGILMVTIPAAVGLICLGEPILRVLFQWGNFSEGDVERVFPVLCGSAVGIPFYALGAVAIRAFHAQQSMRAPLHIGIVNMVANLFLTASFLVPFGVTGMAVANSLAALFQWFLLERLLKRTLRPSATQQHRLLPIVFASGGLILWISFAHFFLSYFHFADKTTALLKILIDITFGGAIYVLILRVMHFAEVSLLMRFLGISNQKHLDR